MTTIYYTASSLDGFIADETNSLDWLLRQDIDESGPLNFDSFFAGVGAVVMGSTTYEWVLNHENGVMPYTLPSWVMTTRDLPKAAENVRFASGDVRPVHAAMTEAADGKDLWVVGGGDLAGMFADAGLPEDWQPTSWDEILDAARALQQLDGVTPIQLNAGTPMGEATTMQGFLPLLVGTGAAIWEDGLWQGASPEIQQVLELYSTIYVEEELGDPLLQQEAAGRDNSFLQFSEGEIGMLIEGDYLWRSVINPGSDIAPMDNRDDVIGWARIPAMQPGAGVGGQDFVSMSGGGGQLLNPYT